MSKELVPGNWVEETEGHGENPGAWPLCPLPFQSSLVSWEASSLALEQHPHWLLGKCHTTLGRG